jgi:peptide/nickel transport system substrate-binding protein
MRKLLLAGMALTAAITFGSPQQPAKAAPGELVWGDTLPKALDPHVVFDVPMQFLLLNAYDGLYRYAGNRPS